jgi:hypothetical protein
VIFGGSFSNNQLIVEGGTAAVPVVLTIGPNILIHGSQTAQILNLTAFENILNQGTLSADTTGRTLSVTLGLTNQGTLEAIGGALVIPSASTSSGLLHAGVGGTISVTGGFTNYAGGSVAIDIGGTAASLFGRISISGSAAFAGTLNLSAVNGFDPNIGNSFNAVTYTSRTGQFDTVNGNIGNGKEFTVTYGPSVLTVNTIAAPAPAPAPGAVAPAIKSLTKVDDNIHIQFKSVAGRHYRVEWTDDLATGNWNVLTDDVVGTGEMMKVIDAGGGTLKQCFYRVVETMSASLMKR